jgi:hypothetical protein
MMAHRARIALLVLLAAAIGACGIPATPAPSLPPTLERPTRVAVIPTIDPLAGATATPPPTAVVMAPTSTPTRERPSPTPTITLIPATATPAPPTDTPAPTPTRTPDIANGELLFNNHINDDTSIPTCVSCHPVVPTTDEELALIQGPSMVAHGNEPGIAIRARERVPGQTPAEYLRISILDPNAYLVPNSSIPDKGPYAIMGVSIMFQGYAEVLTTDQVNDLVAYLLTLR